MPKFANGIETDGILLMTTPWAWSTTLEYKAREKNADTSQEESIILYYAIAIDLNEKLFLNSL